MVLLKNHLQEALSLEAPFMHLPCQCTILLSTFGFHRVTWNKASLKNSEGLSVGRRACDLVKLKAKGTERVGKQHLPFIFPSTKCSTLRGWKPLNNGYKLINSSWTPNFISFALSSHGMKCINSTIRVDREPYFSVSRWVPIMRTRSQARLLSLPIPSSLLCNAEQVFTGEIENANSY